MEHFNGEYVGDNENRAWVRKAMESKGFKLDQRKVVMCLSQPSVNLLFFVMMRKEFPDYV